MKTADIYTAYMYSYPHKMAYGALAGIQTADYVNANLRGGLYFHVPFCQHKCGFCNLFSITGCTQDFMAAYITACEAQMQEFGVSAAQFSTATVGGGDPFCLPLDLFKRLLRLCGTLEIYIEASPNHTTHEKLSLLKAFNLRRLSLGVQSFVESELQSLKRNHTAQSAKNALDLIANTRPACVNIDLIYGIPRQTIASFDHSLEEALRYAPDEIFIYPLYTRSGTPMEKSAGNPHVYEMYQHAVKQLTAAGYTQASMRRFVRDTESATTEPATTKCTATIPATTIPTATEAASPDATATVAAAKNCGFENMLAIGCGGRSYIGNLHFCHPYATQRQDCERIISHFIQAPQKTAINHGYLLNEDEMKRRFVIKNLLHCQGLSFEAYAQAFNSNATADFPMLLDFAEKNYATISHSLIQLTLLGLSLSDYIGPQLISEEVKRRVAAWR